ncbi:MAG TPA: hypothetical protein VG820_12335, partial [Fimbriimonadaceae bacterium]|nr:hypothetical protein [Fimbriimonadaceae bacterium]
GRLLFTGLFVPLLYRLVKRVSGSVFITRLAVSLTILGGGVGFFVWQNFGVTIVRPVPDAISSLMLGRLPIDVWQPEAFVFPSMLTNGLFMVSLCLILVVFESFLDARDGWRPVLWGALAIGILMNIHSYDVLMIAFAMAGFLVMQFGAKQLSAAWVGRGVVIALGVVPAALWFVHVLHNDAVFQARAATPTYSANFRQVFFGYVLMFLLALPGLYLRFRTLRQRLGVGLFSALLIGLFIAAGMAVGPGETYFLSGPAWLGVFVAALASLFLMASDEEPAFNLLLAWGVTGIVGLYFPELFQRKLAMGLAVPWAILATLGFGQMVRGRDRNARNLASIVVTLLLSATSICWLLARDRFLIRNDVSNTTVHPVYLSRDEQEILRLIDEDPRSRKVVVAMPGVASPGFDETGQKLPDVFNTPAMPDLNPIISGLTGAYTFAGHWSETPDYNKRRGLETELFEARLTPEKRKQILDEIKPDYIVQPREETFGPTLRLYGFDLADLSSEGETVYAGNQFKLIRVRR